MGAGADLGFSRGGWAADFQKEIENAKFSGPQEFLKKQSKKPFLGTF